MNMIIIWIRIGIEIVVAHKRDKEMKISELEEELKEGNIINKGFCHDCSTRVEIKATKAEDGGIQIEGGAIYKVKQNLKYEYFFKCDECFVNDPILRHYKICEVYSRVVGYLRPVQQWNKGKQAEFAQRKEFKIQTK